MMSDAIGSAGEAEQGFRRMHRVWIALGSLAGLTAVAMAALAAHGLDWLEPARLQMVRNGVEMPFLVTPQGGTGLASISCDPT
jgi:hypothetical protein